MPHQVTVQKNAQVAKVTILTASQAQYIQPVNPELLTDHLNKSINGLIAGSEHKVYPSNDEFWFPTPENCHNPETLTGIQKRIYDEIVALKKREKLNPDNNLADRETFLAKFPWENSVFNQEQKQKIEALLLKYHIFARHRLDIGANEEFKVKLSPENDKPMYTQGPPTPIHYRDEVLV